MGKKKEPSKTEPDNRVSQVVEVVEESDKSEALETIKEDAQEIEAVATELAQENPSLDEKEKQKEVVEELFQNNTSQISSEITESRYRAPKKLFIWAAIVVSVAVLVGGSLVAISNKSMSVPFMAEPTPTSTPTPTPTPLIDLKRENLKIEVLNGGGTAGAAGKMKTFLEELGYTVTRVGNTEEYTYEQTEILVKAEKEAYITLLKEDLSKEYSIGTTGATLGEDESADAQIIVGKE